MAEAYKVRIASNDDFVNVMKLFRSPDTKSFGNIRRKYDARRELFSKYQTHRFVALENGSSQKIVAYAEFRNSPSIDALHPSSWLEWLRYRYCLDKPITLLNTLFFNFAIYLAEHGDTLNVILMELYYMENKVLYLITVRMPDLPQQDYYNEHFTDLEKFAEVLHPREFDLENNVNIQSLYIIYRYNILPRVTYRRALPEDNDDIIALHEYELPEMRAELGDFYIAEELLRLDEDAGKNYLIVAEIENQNSGSETAGFLWLSTEIDVTFYIKNYEVEQFGNLLSYTESKPFFFEPLHVVSIAPRSEVKLFTPEALDDLQENTILGGLHVNDSGISVASLGKLKVSSIGGTIESSDMHKFYVRESLFAKFYYIVENLKNPKYYINQEKKTINLCYNIGNNNDSQSALQDSTNVFVLKFICIHKKYHLQRLFNFLICAFCAFPDRDYCIMLIPQSATPVRSHLEVLKYFLPVAQRPSPVANLDQMYITHRSTVHGEISLHELQKTDVKLIQDFLEIEISKDFTGSDTSSFSYASKINENAGIEYELKIVNQIMADVLDNPFSEFSFLTIRVGDSTKPIEENTLVGFVALREFDNFHHAYYHYHLPREDFRRHHYSADIITLRLHPLYQIWSENIFRDLARKTNYFDFMFVCPRKDPFCNDLKNYMMNIEPNATKKILIPPKVEATSNQNKSTIRFPKYNFQKDHLILYRHMLKPSKWFGNDSKLVIIGFTDHTKAFLRQLVFKWSTRDHKNSETYTCLSRLQVTVIASPGEVEADYDTKFECPFCLKTSSCYLSYRNSACYVRDVTSRIDLRSWVHFVPGRVAFINRSEKLVKLKNSCEIYYDTLILMCYKNFTLFSEPPCDSLGQLPSNYIEINNRRDKLLLYYKCRVLLEEMPRDYLILVYGYNLQTYECIQFLLTHGVYPTRIVLVVPHIFIGNDKDMKIRNPYRDRNIQYILEEMVTDLGVQIFEDLNFSHWLLHTTGHFIMEVVFKKFPGNKEVKIDCDIFISFEEGHMCHTKKKWIEKCGIQMKGDRILVTKEFKTNDPHIYAAGKFIEMSGRPNYQYEYTSERETGLKLLRILKLGSYQRPYESKYALPYYFQAALPFNYFITKVTKPCRFISSHLSCDQNCSLTTYQDHTFCRVTLDLKMIVEEIVVVTKDDTKLDFLEHFCGKHESLLNNLKARFQEGSIKCFMTFFKAPWSELIMHKYFGNLQAENCNLLRPLILASKENMGSQIFQRSAEKEFVEVNKRFLQESLLNFLRKHRGDFHHEFALPEDFQNNDYPKHIYKMEQRYKVRYATYMDTHLLEELFKSLQATHFGFKRDEHLSFLFLENSSHRLVVYQSEAPNELLAYSEFSIYPNIAVLASDSWIDWLNFRFCIDLPITLMNTMFLNFYIYNFNHPDTLKMVMTEIFYLEPKVTYILVTIPPNITYAIDVVPDYSLFEMHAKLYYPIDFDIHKSKHIISVGVVKREDILPKISFRKAMPEDNDDVVEMIDYEEPSLRMELGDFYIAELLLGTGGENLEKDMIVVAELHQNQQTRNIGLLWLSEHVDINNLITNYDLDQYNNLMKYTPEAEHMLVEIQVTLAERKANYKLFTQSAIKYISYKTILGGLMNDTSNASVKSNGKVQLTSSQGILVGDSRNFYEREYLFSKFQYIYEQLRSEGHYLTKQEKSLEVIFDIPDCEIDDSTFVLKDACNAFVLKKFNLHPWQRLECAYAFLSAMFSAYPQHDYCVVSVPPSINMNSSMREILKYFRLVSHRPGCTIPGDFYITHRSSLYGDLNLHELLQDDTFEINKILDNNRMRLTFETACSIGIESYDIDPQNVGTSIIAKSIMTDYFENPETEFSFWTIRCGNANQSRENQTLVGFIILRPFTEFSSLRKSFLLRRNSYHRTHLRGEVVMAKIYQYFHIWSDELFRLAALKSGFCELYYIAPLTGVSLPNDLIINMMPVEPHRCQKIWFNTLGDEKFLKRDNPFVELPEIDLLAHPLTIFRHNLLTSKFFGNESPLVILGFSDLSKALLRSMIFSWNMIGSENVENYNCVPRMNITVILDNGVLEAEYDNDFQCNYCKDIKNCYIKRSNSCHFVRDTTNRIDLRNWIHFVPGKVMRIDRMKKLVRLKNTCEIHYDKLLLMCDTYFGTSSGDFVELDYPLNYIHINRRIDKILLYYKLLELHCNDVSNKQILVYGCNLSVYECIDFLLKHGCEPSDIIFVVPSTNFAPEYINNPTVDKKLNNILLSIVEDLGITIYEFANFVRWTLYENNNFISIVNFQLFPKRTTLSIHCDIFISFEDNFLSLPIEKLLKENEIEMKDRKILINEDFQTNDPYIYAIGKYTKIREPPNYQYIYTNERETAEKVMHVLKLGRKYKERRYLKPCFFVAQLPMNYMIAKITVPKRYLKGHLSNEYSKCMTTFSGDFCRVRLSVSNIVEEIVCVTRKITKELYFLEHFCGKHESMLNNLRTRWSMGWIKCFLAFFEEPWTELIMHDKFENLQNQNRESLDLLLQQYKKNSNEMDVSVQKQFDLSRQQILEHHLLKFLRRNRGDFVNEIALPEDWRRAN